MTMHPNQRQDRKKILSATIPHGVQNNRGQRFFLSHLKLVKFSHFTCSIFYILTLTVIQNSRVYITAVANTPNDYGMVPVKSCSDGLLKVHC